MAEKTEGERRLRISFKNPEDNKIWQLKSKTAEIINDLEHIKFEAKLNVAFGDQGMEVVRLCNIAQTQLETASMFMTKACTV